MSATNEYDAIVIGGGHNGLVNGAYLAKAGLRTLILERRHLVGGAAITEELRPGFKFTTFSYALSLLRPDIIHDLDLVKHGFMPLLMPSSFCPMENGDSLVMGQDRNENIIEIARHSQADADAYDQYSHDIEMVVRAVKPLFDQAPPDIFATSPEGLAELADLAKHLRGIEPTVLHNLVRLLTGSAADFLDDYFESDIIKGVPLVVRASSAPRSVRCRRAPGSCCSSTGWASTTATSVRGHSTRAATAVSPRCSPAPRRRTAPTSASVARSTRSSPPTDVPSASRWKTAPSCGAKVVVSAADPRRTFTEFVDQRELPDRPRRQPSSVPVPGDLVEGELRARRAADVSVAR